MASGRDAGRDPAKEHTLVFLVIVGVAFALSMIVGLIEIDNILVRLFLVPVLLTAVMFGYRGYCLDTLRLSMEETGESLYYMGFLFTTTSLAAGLTVIGLELQGEDAPSVSNVVISFLPAFGTALWTTIVGLCLRVVMSQGAVVDIDSTYEDVRDQLHQAAAKLREQANLTTDHLAGLLDVVRQKAGELEHGFVSYSESLERTFGSAGIQSAATELKVAAQSLQAFVETLPGLVADDEDRFRQAIESLERVATKIEQTATAQADATRAQGLASQSVSQALSRFSTPSLRQDAERAGGRLFRGVSWVLASLALAASAMVALWLAVALFTFLF